MFVSIKGRTIIYSFAALLAISVSAVCISLKEVHDNMDYALPSSAVESKNILIDAGHGGFDAGASDNGISEKDINLSVAKELKKLIEDNGGKTAMTREGDVSTADENRSDGSSAKKSDLRRRREMIKESGADIFISIHMNKFPQSKYWGAQVFYAATPEDSKRLGECIQAALPRVLGDNNDRVSKKAESGIFILKNAEIPSVIVECGFLSNPDEAEKLKTEDYQKQLARAIFEGLCDFLNK